MKIIGQTERIWGKAAARAQWVAFGYTDWSRLLTEAADADVEDAVDSAIAEAIVALAETEGTWIGTAGRLLTTLATLVDAETRRHPNWPAAPRTMGNAVARLTAMLGARGVVVIRQRSNGVRLITIKVKASSS